MSNEFIKSKYARNLCARELLYLRKDINRCRRDNLLHAAELYENWLTGVRLTCQRLSDDILCQPETPRQYAARCMAHVNNQTTAEWLAENEQTLTELAATTRQAHEAERAG